MNDTDLLKSFGNKIRQLRKDKGWSQTDLANRINALRDDYPNNGGMSKGVLGNIESGKQFVTLKNLHLIANALESSCSELFLTNESDFLLQLQTIGAKISSKKGKELAIEMLRSISKHT